MRQPDALVDLLEGLQSRQQDMLEMLGKFVASESPSRDPARLAATANLIAEHGKRLLGVAPQRGGTDASPVLRWDLAGLDSQSGPVLLLAHLDTVWPAATIDRWPFTVAEDHASGPGAFDMKAGLVQALFALAALTATGLQRPPVILLVTSDEEIGSPSGRGLIEEAARGAAAVLVLEASAEGRLKVARKGVGHYWLRVTGRAAHAGLEPENGINALTAAAQLVLAVEAIADPQLGTTITPTLAQAGSAQNTVPAEASIAIDVRAVTVDEQRRVDNALRAMQSSTGASVKVEGGTNRPPLEEAAARGLLERAQHSAKRCGLPPLGSTRVGGGSDGNFTAALGIPTLDGLGAVGGGAHAEGEYVLASAMPARAALLAGLITELCSQEAVHEA